MIAVMLIQPCKNAKRKKKTQEAACLKMEHKQHFNKPVMKGERLVRHVLASPVV